MKEIFVQEDPTYLSIKKWENKYPHILAGITTSQVNLDLHHHSEREKAVGNRKLISKKLAVPLSNWVGGIQTHETNIQVVTHSDQGKGAISLEIAFHQTDGLITNQKNILLTAYFADCVPIYFFDPITNFIGIVHAGWRGTVKNIAKNMVVKLMNLGVELRNLLVVIGPCISQMNYEVNNEIIQNIHEDFKKSTVIRTENNRLFLDLKQLNVEILLQSGVLHHNIDITNYCTYADADLFFSYRRDKGKTGRMLGYIGII